nr:beta 2-glycoprotein I, beta 2-GPI [rats, Peptide Partial, 10 aa] [Rattus sp.]
GRTCPLPDEL